MIYKFRTMLDLRDEHGNLLLDEYRLAKLGKFLRRSSLDEIPELWNVLKGDMSVVGPRPLRLEYLPFYIPKQMLRHEVKSGMAGAVIMRALENFLIGKESSSSMCGMWTTSAFG